MQETTPVLRMRDIKKEYYGNQVLKGISLEVMPGEIHALCGENGAGKSTLMNILFGMPVIHETGGFTGSVEIGGAPVAVRSPSDAMKLGIGMVHQEFMLIPGFTIAENIKLNREPLKPGLLGMLFGQKLQTLDAGKMAADARAALDRLGMDVDEQLPVAGLPVGYMQFIEIAREIDRENTRLLVFDEPTAVLTESEAKSLLKAMKKLAEDGVGILFITHRLDEVIDAADKVTIMRDGALIGTLNKEDTTIEQLAELMVGRKIDLKQKESAYSGDRSQISVSLRNFRVQMPGEMVRGIDLDVYKGEILGLGGLAGQGKIGVANGLMGLYPADGEVLVTGKPLKLNDAKASIAAGLSFVSEDRRGVGLLPDTAIELNMVIPAAVNQNRFLKGVGVLSQLDMAAVRETANRYIQELDIRCTGPAQPVRRLSGGNQQKVCIARALLLGPDVLLISEPTRGIDVGAKSLVLDTIVKLNQDEGLTVIMTSSELAELRLVCDRIAIITGGKLAGVLRPDDADAAFGLAMSGSTGKGGAQ
ncbi:MULTISPECIES: sugar ABC transporter ATP-binding protein [Anaerotruncus]|uniref:sugar ABC transporter ATP-binding protein n=1 Tax=Anaerotruncus TaxID=244127 RepID=UPI000AEBD45D